MRPVCADQPESLRDWTQHKDDAPTRSRDHAIDALLTLVDLASWSFLCELLSGSGQYGSSTYAQNI
jgi:hypothetical protein